MTSNTKLTRWRRADLLFYAFVAVVLYLRFFRLPLVPINPATGDQAVYLWGATKLLSGQTIYRDFFQFSTPGADYLYALLIKIFGHTASMPQFVTLVVGVLFAMEGLLLSRFFLAGWRAYVPSLLFLTAGYLPLPDATHHVFSTLAALAGLIAILGGVDSTPSSLRPLLVGVSAGVAFCFTYTRGVLVLVAFWLIYCLLDGDIVRRCRDCAIVFGGFVAISLPFLAPIFWHAGMPAVVNCLFEFPLHQHSASLWNTFRAYGIDLPIAGFYLPTTQALASVAGVLALARWALIYLVVPGMYVLASITVWRMASPSRHVVPVIITGFALFFSIAYAPTHFRLGIISLPAFVLLLWWMEARVPIFGRALVVLLGLFAGLTFFAGIFHSQGGGFVPLDTPSGTIAASSSTVATDREKFDWLKQHTEPAMPVLVPDYDATAYLFRLEPPTPLSQMWINGYTSSQQVQQTIAALQQKRVIYVFWSADLQTADPAGEANQLAPLEEYLHDNFVLEHTFNDSDQVWKRKD